MTDFYREWDVAYVLGSLSPAERKDYEQHLTSCASCSDEVAALAGLPGILTAVPREQAAEMLDPVDTSPTDLLPPLTRAARTSQRRRRVCVAAALAGAAAVGALLTAAVGGAPPPEEKAFATELIQRVPSPVQAWVSLVDEPWGTRIDVRCRYSPPAAGEGMTLAYGVYVVDAEGTARSAGTWSAGPGTQVTPSAATDMRRDTIARIEIRLLSTGKTLLEAWL
nr:zf-HC2 domain-containing protein [Kibdelosporangium sp. MJ126-NF4]CEL23473.1 PROBABLE CONSERVED MEMBRANE PROTEIN [Kibdelosporangium sp. MJ126-NF4]CTQ96853.1 possible membrane protein [Kibdelosporangium sp. MJ126-NF4]